MHAILQIRRLLLVDLCLGREEARKEMRPQLVYGIPDGLAVLIVSGPLYQQTAVDFNSSDAIQCFWFLSQFNVLSEPLTHPLQWSL